MWPDGSRVVVCMTWGVFTRFYLYRTDRAKHLITAGQDLDDLQ